MNASASNGSKNKKWYFFGPNGPHHPKVLLFFGRRPNQVCDIVCIDFLQFLQVAGGFLTCFQGGDAGVGDGSAAGGAGNAVVVERVEDADGYAGGGYDLYVVGGGEGV